MENWTRSSREAEAKLPREKRQQYRALKRVETARVWNRQKQHKRRKLQRFKRVLQDEVEGIPLTDDKLQRSMETPKLRA